MATKFGTKLAITRLAQEIFVPIGVFWGWAIECCQLPFFPDCHGNEIWDKIGYNSACVKDICEIFAPIGREVSRMGHWMLQTAFFLIDTRCRRTKFETKLGLCTRYLRDFCVYRGIFGDGPLNAANRIFAHQPRLPWQRNLGQNWL